MGLFKGILSWDEDDDSDYRTLTPSHVYPANVHESRIYPLILELLKRRRLTMLRCYNHRRILRLQELPDWNKIRCNSSNYPKKGLKGLKV